MKVLVNNLKGKASDLLIGLPIVLLLLVSTFLSSHDPAWAVDAPGNNGELKVELITGADPPMVNNEPQVCQYRLHGLHFDTNSSGSWSVASTTPTNNGQSKTGTWSADSSGNWVIVPAQLPNGHYTASAKQTNAPGGEKTKNFYIDCPAGGANGIGGVLGASNSKLPGTGPETVWLTSALLLAGAGLAGLRRKT